ncbi:uncharacterized protein [Parasteatoda tepidariorum]|uniref:uncharacterized protein n=1 Tax=Parasteatoda tepidariorum TaxID=114398 RepID=UPI0039BCB200
MSSAAGFTIIHPHCIRASNCRSQTTHESCLRVITICPQPKSLRSAAFPITHRRIKIERNRSKRSINLNEAQYIEKMLEKYNMHESNPVAAPLDPNQVLTKDDNLKEQQVEPSFKTIKLKSAPFESFYTILNNGNAKLIDRELSKKMSKSKESEQEQRNFLRKQSRRDEVSFQQYSSKLLQDSMISSIPKIVSANNIQLKVLRTLFFVVCVIGFVLQTWEFMQLYWKYETVVSVTVTNNEEVELPSFTICNYYGFKSSAICRNPRFQERCLRISGFTEYRNLCECFHLRYCEEDDVSDHKSMDLPTRSIYEELYSMDFENFTIFLQTTNDLFVHCTLGLTGNDIREDDDCRYHFTRSQFSPKTEFPIVSSCFTFNSMIGKPNTSSQTANSGAYLEFTLNLDPTRHPPFINKTKAQISFHNSRQLIDPYEQGFSMELGKKYTFRLKKIEKNLLPYPYDTNCIDYLEKWKARGGHGPTNERECIQECYTNITLTAYGLSQSKKGFNLKQTITPEMSKEISECQIQNCGPACFDVFYEVSRDVSEIRKGRCNTEEAITELSLWIEISIDLSNLEITTYDTSPKFESIEHFGSIGGYVGMWLGISLVAVFDFLSTALALLKFPFRNFTIKKTRVLSINHQESNKNVEKRENKFWSNYLTNAFRDSMLSGVPQILMAESKIKKYALLLVFLSCLAGYTYQSSEFLKLFWKYETVVDIQLTNSKVTELPSITICNYDGSNISKICEEIKPDWCTPLWEEYRDPFEACKCLPERICENDTLIDKMVSKYKFLFRLNSASGLHEIIAVDFSSNFESFTSSICHCDFR